MVFGFVYAHSMLQFSNQFRSYFNIERFFFCFLCLLLFPSHFVIFSLSLSLSAFVLWPSHSIWFCAIFPSLCSIANLFLALVSYNVMPFVTYSVDVLHSSILSGDPVKRWRVAGTHYTRIIDHVDHLTFLPLPSLRSVCCIRALLDINIQFDFFFLQFLICWHKV